MGIKMRWGTLTITAEVKGSQTSCAIGDIEPTIEYSEPFSPVSCWRPKREAYPRTDLSRI